ncbi:hypothetical protein GCM10020000_01520 [Streptomyces olivoverticillatus]
MLGKARSGLAKEAAAPRPDLNAITTATTDAVAATARLAKDQAPPTTPGRAGPETARAGCFPSPRGWWAGWWARSAEWSAAWRDSSAGCCGPYWDDMRFCRHITVDAHLPLRIAG